MFFCCSQSQEKIPEQTNQLGACLAVSHTRTNENAVGVLFDVASADSSEEMQINEWAACRYRVNEKSFLCFTYSTEMTYVLEYNAEEVSDEEIIKMAESAAPME